MQAETRFRVRYAETDQMGVVHHSNYLVYFEMGRTDLMRHLGIPYAELERQGVILAVTEATCRYRAPARYDDPIRIDTRVSNVRPVRLTFSYEVYHAQTGQLLADGSTVLAAVDRQGKPQRLPEPVLATVRQLG